ncbi:hypothetical protein L914_21287 [Phytophthora nicotianae]|uniref:F-box domain-containing protein n=1 Tax=Phytophthora nicotianae TaxID=4792 RepID=W2M656_PHYNI|nr:hypothetical protein L914_21287 [Phytophthora nicotianae]
MVDNQSRRGRHRSKTPLRSSAKSKASTSRSRQRPTARTRNGVKAQSQATTLPSDLWTQFLPFLTWRDTSAMLSVCCEWRRVVNEAKKLHPEWRSTVLGPSVNGLESLELLRANHLKWADTRFAPDLVLLIAASIDPSPWHSGGYWEEVVAAIEEARLLPPACRLVMMFTLNAVLGTREDEVEEEGSSSAVTLSISVAHLPETTLENAEFARKELRRCKRGVELDNPFTALEGKDAPSFMLFGVNDQSADQLVHVLDEWYPTATVIGAVSPLIDRCVPLATYKAPVNQDRARKKRGGKPLRRPRQVVFPSTMLLRFHGNVGVRSFSSSGYYPITPVVQCERASVAEELSQVVTYDLVSTSEGSQHVLDLIDPSERLAIEQEGRTLNIFSCSDSAPLERLVDFNSNEDTLTTARIDRLEFVFWLQDRLMALSGLCWQEGDYGVLASHQSTRTSQALTEALERTKSGLTERAFGAFTVAGALNDVDDSVHANQVSEIFTDVFQELQIGGCIVSTSVGPVAIPGRQLPGRNRTQVQTHTTCGAVFYTTQ